MRIFYLADSFLPSKRANAVNIVKMCEAFVQLGHEVELIIPTHSDGDQTQAIFDTYDVQFPFEIHFIPVPRLPGTLYLFALKASAYVLRKKSPQPTFYYGRSTTTLALIGWFIRPVGIDVHGTIWRKNIVRRLLFRSLATGKSTRVISFNTSPLKALFREFYGAVMNKGIRLIALANGATEIEDPPLFPLKGSATKLKAGYVGSFFPGRGIDLLVEMARRLPDVEFHLAGGTAADLMKQGLQSNLPNIFCYGHIAHRLTAGFRKGCDVLLAPYQENVRVSSGENTIAYMSPIKIFEYMTSGKPIVCSDFPVLRGVLNSENALLVDAQDLTVWSNAIESLRDPELRKRLGQKALLDFRQRHTWGIRAEKLLETAFPELSISGVSNEYDLKNNEL